MSTIQAPRAAPPSSFRSARRNRRTKSIIFALLAAPLILVSHHSWREGAIDRMLELSGLTLVVVCMLGRIWTSLYIAGYKNQRLIDVGPYSMVRHPLYVFSLLGAVGVGLASENLALLAVMLMLFLSYYPQVAIGEERELALQLPDGVYREYARRVPRFLPNPSLLKLPEQYTINASKVLQALGDALMFPALYVLFESLETLQDSHVLPVLLTIP